MRFISLILILSSGIALSQAEKIHFRTLALVESKFPEFWAIESGKAVPILFPSAQPSAAVTADRTSPFGIFRGPLDDKGKPVDTTPLPVSLPASASILLLGWMNGEKPGFLAIEDPFATMKHDDWLVINSSNSQLAIQIGETAKPVPVKANGHQTIKSSAPSGTGAAVTIASQQADGKWKAVYTSYWPIYDDKRGLVLVVQNGARLNVNYISDTIAPAPVPKP
ncbi:hypothetical protein HQ447_16850 [bacterium]|nr:hypothetical protein [bacterium]